jgi:glycosyltransferase involved in cell wall biosynthesis
MHLLENLEVAPILSIVMPAYNEEKSIGSVLDCVYEVMENNNIVAEIIVVDDGSKDETATEAKKRPFVKVYEHTRNSGYGAAIKTGVRKSRSGVICIVDADSSYPVEVIPDLAQAVLSGDADMVVGARTGAKVAIPLIRKPAKWAIARLAEWVVGQKIPDLNSGLRVFKKNAVKKFFSLLPDGFSFTTTITLGMLTNGFIVDYEPINYHARIGKSKINPIKDTINFTILILRIGLYFAPLKIFLPISFFLLFLAFVWALVSTYVLNRLADVSVIVIVMTSIQVGMIALLAELINRRLVNTFDNDRVGDSDEN